jgi:ABC-type sugar transport system permease subunit
MGLPGMLVLVVFVAVPLFLGMGWSLTNKRLISPLPTQWVGAANYANLLSLRRIVIMPVRDAHGLVVRDEDGQPVYPVVRDITKNSEELKDYSEWFRLRRGEAYSVWLAKDPSFMRALANTIRFVLVIVPCQGGLDGSRSWLDTYRVQMFPFIADAMSTFMFYQFFVGLPKPLDEAAYMEGSNPFQIYANIIVPLSKPVFATVAILNSLSVWNSYLWPLMSTRSERVRPLPLGITALYVLNMRWGYILAFATLIIAPILLLFLIFQRWFVASIVSSGVKG